MTDSSGARNRPFAVINQGTNDAAWDGSPVTLLPNRSVRRAVTPNGTTVLVYLNEGTGNSPATPGLTSGRSAPLPLTAPPLLNLPSILISNWKTNQLGLTNVTPPQMHVPVNM